jgi:PIN domain nuclease of toxin-antitoxin system
MIFADTHVLVWLAKNDPRLPEVGRAALVEEGFSLSVTTAFEYADLHQRGRLPQRPTLIDILADFGATVEPLPAESWSIVNKLPPIHRDPVDRMLIAHAMIAEARLATADTNIRRYPVKTLW